MGQPEEIRRFLLNGTNSRRSSFCSSRIVEIPVENFVYQTQIDTLQWQLKQTEASREMYRAVMKQVVMFLEKAHRSLELLGCRLNPSDQTFSRTKSEHHVNVTDDSNISPNATLLPDTSADYSSFRDFTWRRPKKPQTLPDEIPPEKLSQEAFRLLRTAQSLLNTREPDLAQMNKECEDSKFLEQLAKEFPPPKESSSPTQRTSSFSLSTKLLKQDKEPKISTAFNRKLSLQLTPSDFRRNSLTRDSGNSNSLSHDSRNSHESRITHESRNSILPESRNSISQESRSSISQESGSSISHESGSSPSFESRNSISTEPRNSQSHDSRIAISQEQKNSICQESRHHFSCESQNSFTRESQNSFLHDSRNSFLHDSRNSFSHDLKSSLSQESRNSFSRESGHSYLGKLNRTSDSGSLVSNDCCILSSALNEEFGADNRMINIHKCGKMKYESEKSTSPPVSTVSSMEDESGFSSMNSFQEVGVPLVNSTLLDEIHPKDYSKDFSRDCSKDYSKEFSKDYSKDFPKDLSKDLFLKDMSKDVHSKDFSKNVYSKNIKNGSIHMNHTENLQTNKHGNKPASIEEIKLWQRGDQAVHKRWNSTPVENVTNDKQSLKVLWV